MQTIDRYNLSRDEWEHLIDQWVIGRNAERNRDILKRRLLDGYTYDRLADTFFMSRPQIVRICYRGQDQIFRHIG